MHQKRILCPPCTEAIAYASAYLEELGFDIVTMPDADAAHLLLPVPSFPAADTFWEGVGNRLSHDILISGGNLNGRLSEFRTVDFLKDPRYLAENAAITASCALKIVESRIGASLDGCPVLITGWGRIGKCLCRLLRQAGADVTVAARKEADRAMIHALGCRSITIEDAAEEIRHYRVILGTVPEMILPDIQTSPDCVILELASRPGMTGRNITDARGLPNKIAPDASGKLIAQTFIRLSLGKEV